VLASTGAATVGGAAIDVAGVAGAAIFGVVGAIAQWLALRPLGLASAAWVWSTASGNVVAWLAAIVGGVVGYAVGIPLAGVVGWGAALLGAPLSAADTGFLVYGVAGAGGGATGGLIVAACQWRLVRAWAGRRAADRWLAVTPGAGAAAGAVGGGDLFFRVIAFYAGQAMLGVAFVFPNALLAGAAFGAVYGVIPGLALVRLRRAGQPDSQSAAICTGGVQSARMVRVRPTPCFHAVAGRLRSGSVCGPLQGPRSLPLSNLAVS
jgi:hypothetical protein